eukprot:CAMPEP_0177211546 /NCGR_PEP_ID=MMETSP0367-20130122/32152_1 /TAXON_ID=447022 ORGANISM="Scrippsiella hangoei-like, Strain SHHI-4" /NCGR_SAMPLE_ID=MMETSP0367 /ASSEMBLY_ACC=CAM_ASM_000362 /LENGTH=94 /DNA_ID=CAMNT_0018660743 /DNA_START=173 /DNA_END=454 /DNA_ORIENTATION=+
MTTLLLAARLQSFTAGLTFPRQESIACHLHSLDAARVSSGRVSARDPAAGPIRGPGFGCRRAPWNSGLAQFPKEGLHVLGVIVRVAFALKNDSR